MSQIKVAWYVLREKNMHPWSLSDPSGTSAAEAKPRCVYSILKPHGQRFKSPVRPLSPQNWSQAVMCLSTLRMYPRSGYFLVVSKKMIRHEILSRASEITVFSGLLIVKRRCAHGTLGSTSIWSYGTIT